MKKMYFMYITDSRVICNSFSSGESSANSSSNKSSTIFLSKSRISSTLLLLVLLYNVSYDNT